MSEEPKTREEILEHLKILNVNMLSLSKGIRTNTFTRKKTEEHYPLEVGYSYYVRRPMRDLLKWMDTVEETIYTLVDLLEDPSK